MRVTTSKLTSSSTNVISYGYDLAYIRLSHIDGQLCFLYIWHGCMLMLIVAVLLTFQMNLRIKLFFFVNNTLLYDPIIFLFIEDSTIVKIENNR